MGKRYTDPLAFILDGEAESATDERCTDLEPSRALQEKWGEWTETVTKALLDWGATAGRGDAIARLIAASDPGGRVDVAYDVYMTLDGAGVGMWDGRWDPYLDDISIKRLKAYLGGTRTYSDQGLLGKAFSTIQDEIRNEAYEQCAHLHGTHITDDLNGAPDADDRALARLAELKRHGELARVVRKKDGSLAIKREDGSVEEVPNRVPAGAVPRWIRPSRRS